MIRKNIIIILASALVLFLLAACASVDSSTHRGEKSYKTDKTESAEEKSDEQEVQNQEEEQKEHLYLRALTNVRLRKEPSTKGEYLATIQKGDCFEVFETKKAEGYTWNRIFDSVWVADDGTWMEKIESLPDMELNLTGFDNPVKIVETSKIDTMTIKFDYIGGELNNVIYEYSDGRTDDIGVDGDLLFRCYGKNVSTLRDEQGRIIEQVLADEFGSDTRQFIYNDKNQIVDVAMFQTDWPERVDHWYFDYYQDGKLYRKYSRMPIDDEYVYNGNLVCSFLADSRDGSSDPAYFYRFDSKGRIIQWFDPARVYDYYY